MTSNSDCIDITSELRHVHGGNRAKAIWSGVKRAYQAGRPILKESADVAKDVGVIGGVAYGAKKAWDMMTGGDQQPAPQPQPQK